MEKIGERRVAGVLCIFVLLFLFLRFFARPWNVSARWFIMHHVICCGHLLLFIAFVSLLVYLAVKPSHKLGKTW